MRYSCTVVTALSFLILSISAKSFAVAKVNAGSVTAAESCATMLTPTTTLSPTDAIISTLKDLYNSQVLTVDGLIAIRNGKNPLEQKQSVDTHAFSDVVDVTIAQLEQNPEARAKLDGLIRELSSKQIEKEIKTVETAQTFLPMAMYEIPGGSFTMGDTDKGHTLAAHATPANPATNEEVIKSFYIADIPVTQWQYAFVMRDLPEPNPSHFKDGPNSKFVKIDDKEILMQPNHPVENVSWQDVQNYVAILNQWSQEDNPLIYQIISNHIRHAHVRLLTGHEWSYVARNCGSEMGMYPDGLTVENLSQYAWHCRNSNWSTQPVAELRAFMINGHPVYDLLGNVSEWTQNQNGEYGGATRGGNWNSIAHDLRIEGRYYIGPDSPSKYIGLRLAEDAPL